MTESMEQFNDKSAQEVLSWALSEYGDKIAAACSFGAEDMVLVEIGRAHV